MIASILIHRPSKVSCVSTNPCIESWKKPQRTRPMDQGCCIITNMSSQKTAQNLVRVRTLDCKPSFKKETMSMRNNYVRGRHFYFMELANHSASSRNARLKHKPELASTIVSMVQLVTSQVVSYFPFFLSSWKMQHELVKIHAQTVLSSRAILFAKWLFCWSSKLSDGPKFSRHFDICRSYERLSWPFPALFSGH